jgi:hypothetical protein
VVARPLRRAETLALYSGSCVAPLRLGGRRGKQSTPRVGWEVPVSVPRLASRKRQEHRSRGGKRIRPRYVPELSRVVCIVIYCSGLRKFYVGFWTVYFITIDCSGRCNFYCWHSEI